MKIRRDIASTPQRTAQDTWRRIVKLISNGKSTDPAQLEAAASVMEALIAEEHPTEAPIVVSGCGPRLVIYLRYDGPALELGDAVEELSWNPTDGDWRISAPTAAEDIPWMKDALKQRAPRITVRDRREVSKADDEDTPAASLTINWGAVGQ